jgi:hypothetical protein
MFANQSVISSRAVTCNVVSMRLMVSIDIKLLVLTLLSDWIKIWWNKLLETDQQTIENSNINNNYSWYKYAGTILKLDSREILVLSNELNSPKTLQERSLNLHHRTKIRWKQVNTK